jgi:hypothetical protein
VSEIIYADVVSNCDHDNITLNGTAMIAESGPGAMSYIWVNDTEFGHPVKRFSADQKSMISYSFNITSWF